MKQHILSLKYSNILALGLACFMVGSQALAEDWPRFRGPGGQGISEDSQIPTEWSSTKNLKWKLSLPGGGVSSPIVLGDKVFVTCSSSSEGKTRYQLLCVDRNKGKVVWSKEVIGPAGGGRRGGFGGRFGGRGGRGGGRFSSQCAHTPVSDGERIYAMFGRAGIVAYDKQGKKLWQKSVGNESNSTFGSASSPIVYKGMVIVTAGNESTAMYAFDGKTGKEKWKAVAGPLASCYGTPVIARNAKGKDELLISVTNEVWSLNPNTGKLNWYCETSVDTNACTSLVAKDGVAYAVGGRRGGRTAIKIGGKDDVTRSNVLWSESGGTYVPSPILHKGHLYYINRGIVYCVSARTGTVVMRKRINGDPYASPVVVNGKLIVVTRSQGTYILEASPKLTQLAHNTLEDRGDFSATPAISSGQLFLRSSGTLYCIAAKPKF